MSYTFVEIVDSIPESAVDVQHILLRATPFKDTPFMFTSKGYPPGVIGLQVPGSYVLDMNTEVDIP